MAISDLPFATGMVYGTFAQDVYEDDDESGEVSTAPLQNVTVKFTPNIEPNFVQNVFGTPATYVIEPVYGVTNALGQLVLDDRTIPINLREPGIELIASVDDNINPTNWTWNAELNAPNLPTLTIDFTISNGQDIDLARVTPIPPDLDGALEQWQLAVAAAEDAISKATLFATQAGQSAAAAAQYATDSATQAGVAASAATGAAASKTAAEAAKVAAAASAATAEVANTSAQNAAVSATEARDEITDLAIDIDQSIGAGYQRLEEHRVSPLPHPAYDDMNSLILLFENKLL